MCAGVRVRKCTEHCLLLNCGILSERGRGGLLDTAQVVLKIFKAGYENCSSVVFCFPQDTESSSTKFGHREYPGTEIRPFRIFRYKSLAIPNIQVQRSDNHFASSEEHFPVMGLAK